MKHKFYILIIALAIMAGGCTVKKSLVSTEKTSDSISTVTEITFQPGEVPVDIKGDSAKDAKILELTANLSNVQGEYFILVNEVEGLMDSLEWYKAHPNEKSNRIEQVIEGSRKVFNTDVSHLETQLAYSDAWVKSGKLFHTLNQKDTTIHAHSDSAVKLIETKKDSYHSSDTTIIDKKVIKKQGWITIAILAIVAVIGIYFYKRFFK